MDIRQNPLQLGFALPGRWFETTVRVSFWLPLLGVALCFRLGLVLGLWVSLLLFVSILIHEFAHVLTCRRTGGSGDEILMWPLGGLAFVRPAQSFFSEFWTTAAGPISNFLLCLVTLPAVLSAGLLRESTDLVYLPPVELSGTLGRDLLVLMFSLNLKLMLLNLLPVYPLDGGQLACTIAKLYWPSEVARLGSLFFGVIVSAIVVMAGMLVDSTPILFFGTIILVLCLHEHLTARMTPHFDESFLGYDFSQGYTSLERDDEFEPRRPVSPFERWKQQREEKRREKEVQERLEVERRVDELLDKVHREGMDSLSEAERRFLKRASTRYKGPEV